MDKESNVFQFGCGLVITVAMFASYLFLFSERPASEVKIRNTPTPITKPVSDYPQYEGDPSAFYEEQRASVEAEFAEWRQEQHEAEAEYEEMLEATREVLIDAYYDELEQNARDDMATMAAEDNRAALADWEYEQAQLDADNSYDCLIKGNVAFDDGEKIYHMPGQKYYDNTEIDENYGERWFCTEAEAQAAGWRKAYE